MLTRAEFQHISEGALADFLLSPPADAYGWGIRTTSGTSNGSPLVVATRYQSPMTDRYAGVERTLVCAGPLCIRLQNLVLARCAPGDTPLRVMTLDNRDLTPALEKLVTDFKPGHTFGFLAFAVRALEYCGSIASSGLRRLDLTGQRLTGLMEKHLRDMAPHSQIAMSYNAVELGVLSGPQCPYLLRNQYHPAAGVTFEISNPDEHGVGDILVSMRVNTLFDVHQYRIGDLGRIVTARCACGETTTLEHMGKAHFDVLKIAGALLVREEFDRVAQKLGAFDDYRAEASTQLSDGKATGSIALRIYRRSGAGTAKLAQEMGERFAEELFVTPTQTLSMLISKGIFLPLTVEWSEEAFPVQNKEMKLVDTDPQNF